MKIRFSRLAASMLVVAAVVLASDCSWAIFNVLGPSKDEWGLKYDVAVSEAGGDNLTIVFTLADEGRLKPIYKIDLVAFSKQTDSQGGRAYDVLVPLKLKPTEDGKAVGQVQMRKEFLDRAHFRILTRTVDGQPQPSGGAVYNVWIKKHWKNAPADASPLASPRALKFPR